MIIVENDITVAIGLRNCRIILSCFYKILVQIEHGIKTSLIDVNKLGKCWKASLDFFGRGMYTWTIVIRCRRITHRVLFKDLPIIWFILIFPLILLSDIRLFLRFRLSLNKYSIRLHRWLLTIYQRLLLLAHGTRLYPMIYTLVYFTTQFAGCALFAWCLISLRPLPAGIVTVIVGIQLLSFGTLGFVQVAVSHLGLIVVL